MDLAERWGRGRGEGTLVITDCRLIFRLDANGSEVTVPLKDVTQMAAARHPYPKMVEIGLFLSSDEEWVRFWTGASAFLVLRREHPEKWAR